MKSFSVSTLLLLAPSASGRSLRGDFERDVAVDEGRSLAHHCVDGAASYLGCFEDRNNDRVFSKEVDDRPHTAEECQSACRGMGHGYFAREWKGQCFCGDGEDYDRHGAASNCDCCGDNVGSRKMCVWTTGEAAPGCDGDKNPGAPYLGCFHDKNLDRAMPFKVAGQRHSAKTCRDECKKRGMDYFAREWKGQCFCSDDDDYDKHGMADDCDCCGDNVGSRKLCVWQG